MIYTTAIINEHDLTRT